MTDSTVQCNLNFKFNGSYNERELFPRENKNASRSYSFLDVCNARTICLFQIAWHKIFLVRDKCRYAHARMELIFNVIDIITSRRLSISRHITVHIAIHITISLRDIRKNGRSS